jgi:hypothetical protein
MDSMRPLLLVALLSVLALSVSSAGASRTPPLDVGKAVLLTPQTKTSGCTLGPNPDRRCSGGAYSSKLTKAVICSSKFRTGPIRNVPDSEKHQVELEYGLAAKGYGSTLEIDHIVSLELGGSNSIANLFPERANAGPGYHVKDRLENRLHALVCAGALPLRTAQRAIARDWRVLYSKVFYEAAARRSAESDRRCCGIAAASAVSAASRSPASVSTIAPTGVAQYGQACQSGSSGARSACTSISRECTSAIVSGGRKRR